MNELSDFISPHPDLDVGAEVELPNNNRAYIRKSDPEYGFFNIKFAIGNTPTELQGQYTGISEARKAVEIWLTNNK